MTYKVSAMMFILWGMLAAVTMVVELENDQSALSGSTADFENFANTIANPDSVGINEVSLGQLGDGNNPIAGAWDFVKQAVGWVTFMARSMLLQSPIWEGWTQPIRWAIMLISIPYMFHVVTIMMGAATNMIGGIAKLIPGV